jgi:hypothetical protein
MILSTYTCASSCSFPKQHICSTCSFQNKIHSCSNWMELIKSSVHMSIWNNQDGACCHQQQFFGSSCSIRWRSSCRSIRISVRPGVYIYMGRVHHPVCSRWINCMRECNNQCIDRVAVQIKGRWWGGVSIKGNCAACSTFIRAPAQLQVAIPQQ